MAELVDLQTVSVKKDLGSTLEDCVRSLATLLAGTGRLSGADAFVADVLAREEKGSTALPGGVALPHARSAAVLEPTVVVATLPTPIVAANGHDFDLVFLLAVPDTQADQYLTLLRIVTTAAVKPAFRDDCRSADSPARLSVIAADAFA